MDPENLSFINNKGKRIDSNSSYKVILKEIHWLGINTSNITINELLDELDLKLAIKHNLIVQDKTYLEQLREYSEFHNQIRVLYKHIIADAFNLYSYDEDKSLDTYSKIFDVDYVKLNCKLKIYKISERILKTRKLPIHILETELFTSKDFIISENLSNLDYVLNSFDEYLKTSIEYENYENILISMKIVEDINTHKYHLINYLDQITLKLECLYSKTSRNI